MGRCAPGTLIAVRLPEPRRAQAECGVPSSFLRHSIRAGMYALTIVLATLPALHVAAAEGNYPERAIRLVVPFPAGGINDVLARVWANTIGPHLGTIVVENRGGGGSMIGSAEVAHAAPDGYTLLLGNSTNQILNPQMMRSPPFDPAKAFEAVTILTKIPNVIAVHPSLPVHSLKELVDYARSHPGQLSYGSAGVGTMTHLSAELFKKLASGLDMVHVPYRGGAPGTADLTGGNVPVMSLSAAAQLFELHREGKIRILCVNAPARVEAAMDIPTAVEAGYPGMVVQVFNGIFAPAGTPKPIVEKIAQASNEIMSESRTTKDTESLGCRNRAQFRPHEGGTICRRGARTLETPIIKASGIEVR